MTLAITVVEPLRRARTNPVTESTAATMVSPVVHRRAGLVAGSQDAHWPVTRSVSPTCSVAVAGDTATAVLRGRLARIPTAPSPHAVAAMAAQSTAKPAAGILALRVRFMSASMCPSGSRSLLGSGRRAVLSPDSYRRARAASNGRTTRQNSGHSGRTATLRGRCTSSQADARLHWRDTAPARRIHGPLGRLQSSAFTARLLEATQTTSTRAQIDARRGRTDDAGGTPVDRAAISDRQNQVPARRGNPAIASADLRRRAADGAIKGQFAERTRQIAAHVPPIGSHATQIPESSRAADCECSRAKQRRDAGTRSHAVVNGATTAEDRSIRPNERRPSRRWRIPVGRSRLRRGR